MSATHDYEDLHHLLERLSPEQARRLRVLADADPELRGLLTEPSGSTEPAPARDRLLTLAGIWENGPVDASERHDELIRERLTRLS